MGFITDLELSMSEEDNAFSKLSEEEKRQVMKERKERFLANKKARAERREKND